MLIKIKYNAIQLLFILNSVFVFAQISKSPIIPVDSTLNIKNSEIEINKKDTILYKLDKQFGLVYLLDNTFVQTINKNYGLEINYAQMSDLLSNEINYYPMFQGSFGLYDTFQAFGGGHRDNSYKFNGRNILSPDSRIFNINEYSTEAFENIQILKGSEASIIGGASGGLFLNFQEIQYNSKTPFTKLWYTDAGKDFLTSDGIFSQNIMANTNFTFGFRKMSTTGEFTNQWMESWNVRNSIRYSFNEYSNMSFSYNLSNLGNGTNGGISLQSQNIFSR
ncbi:MAG: TonB-dependent receptor, partial [Candidatus Kapabacteria bacterium]|nr:TonB-dependent receptor [Candidatus Kapabacteria bacterium]